MTYEEICQSNQCLYAELETVSYKLFFTSHHGMTSDNLKLMRQRHELKLMIDINLGRLDDIWYGVNRKAPRFVGRRDLYNEALGLRPRIMAYYHSCDDPDTVIIADIMGISEALVRYVVTEHFERKIKNKFG